ncbi:MAG: response regulator [Acetobacteraceae bacterium]
MTGVRVMVVEDEALVAMMILEYLEDLGCQVVATASRLQEALEKAADVQADVGLLDVNLAGQMSYPVAEVLRGRGIPVVFATGYGTDGLPSTLRNVPVLSKPFRQHQLADALQSVRQI